MGRSAVVCYKCNLLTSMVKQALTLGLLLLCTAGSLPPPTIIGNMVNSSAVSGGGGGGSLVVVSADPKVGAHNALSTGSLTHTLTSVTAGALLLVATASESDASGGPGLATPTVADSTGLTWTKRSDASAASSGNAEIWTAVFTAGGNTTVTVDWGVTGPTGPQRTSVCYVITGQESTLAGNQNTGTAQAAPSVAVTTTRANSIIFCVTSDWAAIAGARTYRTPSSISPTLDLEDQTGAGSYNCSYIYRYQATTATSYTVGISSPSTMQAGTAVYEVRTP